MSATQTNLAVPFIYKFFFIRLRITMGNCSGLPLLENEKSPLLLCRFWMVFGIWPWPDRLTKFVQAKTAEKSGDWKLAKNKGKTKNLHVRAWLSCKIWTFLFSTAVGLAIGLGVILKDCHLFASPTGWHFNFNPSSAFLL